MLLFWADCVPVEVVLIEAWFLEDDRGIEEEDGGKGWSRATLSSVSAATMPPIECPTSTTWTDGSTVGLGVSASTSRSMTLF